MIPRTLNRPTQLARHVLGAVAFLMLPYVFAPDGFGQLAQIGHDPHQRTNLLGYGLMLVFFYIHYYRLIPRLYFEQRYGRYGLCLVVGFVVIMGVMTARDRFGFGHYPAPPRPAFPAPDALLPPPHPTGFPPNAPAGKPYYGFELSHALFLFLVGIFVTLSLAINARWRETEQQRMATELSFLKAQINPHFLFNTLNSIYALAIEGSVRTPDALIKLSSFMRYVTRDSGSDWVPLARELDYIGQYIDLQRLRLDDTATVQYTVEGSAAGLRIAPMLLISFVENAFKYGVNPATESIITVSVRLQADELHLLVFNKKLRLTLSDENVGGIGLNNTRTRLQLLYPDRHRLTIQDQHDAFTVDLHLHLL